METSIISPNMKTVLYVLLLCETFSLNAGHHRQKRIVLGTEAEPNSRPYQAHVIMEMRNGDVQLCGGALISPKYVLTAAHCFVNLENLIRSIVIMGAHNLRDQNKEYQISKNYIIHGNFKKFAEGHTINDIAMIKMNDPFELKKNIQVIALPRRSQVNNSFNNVNATEAGWGKTENDDTPFILMQGSSQVAEAEDVCTHPKPLICTWSIDGHSPCIGDSGAPLVFNNTVIGLVSSGFCIVFSYYTRVTSYLDWIEENSDVKILD